jgi:hypothetical protein
MARSSFRDWVRRMYDADNVEEAERIARANLSGKAPESNESETRENVPTNPRVLSAQDDLGQGSHTHIYLGGGKGGGNTADDPVETGTGAAAAPATAENRIAALEAEVAEMRDMLEQLLGNDEEDVELEDPSDPQHDARRFTMRRGAKMRSKPYKDELDVPEHRPEMMGATDLPGIEDLDERMHGNRSGDRRRVRDSADMEDNWRETMAKAEIIVPGFKLPTFDARLEPARTAERLCSVRRRVMDAALQNEKTADFVKDFGGITSRDQIMGREGGRGAISCDSLKFAFNATAAAIRGQTNDRNVRREVSVVDSTGGTAKKGPPSLAEMNKNANAFWNKNPAATRH